MANMWTRPWAIFNKIRTDFNKTLCASEEIRNCLFPALISWCCTRARVFIVLIYGAQRMLCRKWKQSWLWISNYCFLHKEQNTETDAGGKFTWALKQSPWRPGFKCVWVLRVWQAHACARARVMFHKSWPDIIYRSVSPCKDEHASIWRAKSAVSVRGQLVLRDDRGTLVRRKTG